MKYLPLKSALFVENRARFTATMAPRSLAIFHSNDLYPTGADGTLPFKQASDIYWLSGVDQEESVLVLFPNAAKPEQREMLFLTETNAHIAVWEGAKLDKNQAFDVSGIKTVYWLQEWDRVMKELMSQTEHVYLVTEEHLRRNNPVETRTMRLNKVLKSAYPHHHYKRSAPALNSLRAVKTQDEVEVMQMA
ncbi:MAG TPA: X-Pro aminopeptidase, partial [Cryomorphaceae bacterium]|nr:X-Pro aminopeptidase [Cryomorphaceae bacterium]